MKRLCEKMKVECKLSVEQVHAELQKAWAEFKATQKTAAMNRMGELIDQLPRADVVGECLRVAMGDEHTGACPEDMRFVRVVLRRYRELRGLPADPDLENFRLHLWVFAALYAFCLFVALSFQLAACLFTWSLPTCQGFLVAAVTSLVGAIAGTVVLR